MSSSTHKIHTNLGIFAPMKMKTLFFSVLLSAVMGPAVLWAQPTLVDPIEVFEGSLDDPANEEIALHWDVTNLTETR